MGEFQASGNFLTIYFPNFRSAIKKSRPYYERKEVLTRTMNSQLELMSILEHEVRTNKNKTVYRLK